MACTNIVEPPLPDDAEQFSPPAVYSTWWQMTQACSALTGSLAGVTWYQTSKIVYDTESGDVIAGYWLAASNRIVLTSSVMLDGGIVRHEMLHALIRKGGHPRGQFLGNCAGTVDCEEACAASAGSYPPPSESPSVVSGDGIEITLAVNPATPAHGIDEARFSVTVFARNKSAHWVTVAPASGSDPRQTFSVDVRGAYGYTASDRRAIDPSQTIFAPNETKRQVFDLVVGDYPIANQLLPGDYVVRAAFAGWWSNESSFSIAQ
ncbi:MAG: hypothetical protein ACJ794_09920 [Gemmatimonadaceae bacterium]